jgi:hypothetical protein
MADSDSDGEIDLFKPTPKRLFIRLTQIKKFDIVRGETFRSGIVQNLEEILGVSRQDLSSEKLKKFDSEVEEFHSYVPRCLKACHRNRKRMLKKFKKYFNRLIVLPSDSVSIGGAFDTSNVNEVRFFLT